MQTATEAAFRTELASGELSDNIYWERGIDDSA